MKLWKISQTVNDGYDTYDSAIVCAGDAESARNTHPSQYGTGGTWAVPEHVTVEYVGEAAEDIPPGVLLASFNAG